MGVIDGTGAHQVGLFLEMDCLGQLNNLVAREGHDNFLSAAFKYRIEISLVPAPM